MNISKKKLAEQLAASLEQDVGSFAKQLQSNVWAPSPAVQSNVLLRTECHPASNETGEILMQELLNPLYSDVVLKVREERFSCHKEVLSARCEYFHAMLKSDWNEASSTEISINNVKPGAVASLLSFFYGASVEMPNYCSLVEILQAADMFSVSGLIDVIKLHIKTDVCHSFHKPCKDCIANAPEVIQLSYIFSLTDVLDMSLKWNVKYFSKLWPTKGFASLQSDLRKKCVAAAEESLSLNTAVHVLMEVDKLLSSITRVQWTVPVVDMGTKLLGSCCDYISSNILALTGNKSILVLFQGMGWKTDIVERILVQIGESLSIENVCGGHLAVSRLLILAQKENWIEEFPKMLSELKEKIWCFMVSNYYAVIHTESWQLVSSSDKMDLKAETFCSGDPTRKLSKKPILSSSLHKKPPTPTVLKRPPMKVKPRKVCLQPVKPNNLCGRVNRGQNLNVGEITPECEEPPDRMPVLCDQEFLIGGFLQESVIIAYMFVAV